MHLVTRLQEHQIATTGHVVKVKPVAVRRASIRFGEKRLPTMQAYDLHTPDQGGGVFKAQSQRSRGNLSEANGSWLLG